MKTKPEVTVLDSIDGVVDVRKNIVGDALNDLDSASYSLLTAAIHLEKIYEAIQQIARINETFKTQNLFKGDQ